MPDSCSAWGCKNRRTTQTKALGITFHKFPKAKELRLQWDTAVRREGFFTKKYAVVCSEHFRLEDFDSTGQTVRIRDGAVPIAITFPSPLHTPPVPARTTQTSQRAAESLVVKTEPLPDVPVTIRRIGTSQTAAERRSVTETLPDVPVTIRRTHVFRRTEESRSVAEPLPDVPVTTRRTHVFRRTEESRSVTEPLPDVEHSYALSASPADLKVRLREALARVESLERQVRNLKDRERRAKTALQSLLKHLRGTLPSSSSSSSSTARGGRYVIRTRYRKTPIR